MAAKRMRVLVVYKGDGSTEVPGLGTFENGIPQEFEGSKADLALALINSNANFEKAAEEAAGKGEE